MGLLDVQWCNPVTGRMANNLATASQSVRACTPSKCEVGTPGFQGCRTALRARQAGATDRDRRMFTSFSGRAYRTVTCTPSPYSIAYRPPWSSIVTTTGTRTTTTITTTTTKYTGPPTTTTTTTTTLFNVSGPAKLRLTMYVAQGRPCPRDQFCCESAVASGGLIEGECQLVPTSQKFYWTANRDPSGSGDWIGRFGFRTDSCNETHPANQVIDTVTFDPDECGQFKVTERTVTPAGYPSDRSFTVFARLTQSAADSGSSGSSGAVAGAVVGVLLALALVAGLLFYRQRTAKAQDKGAERPIGMISNPMYSSAGGGSSTS